MKKTDVPLGPASGDRSVENSGLQGTNRCLPGTKKILVIDYNEAILDVMKIIITDAGYAFLSPLPVLILAPEKIYALQPDLILIEDQLYNLPQGRKISLTLKKSDLTSSIPIVMMTTAETEPDQLISESAADTVLIKPFDIGNLEAVLHRCVRHTY